jgi:hypothetical protein
MRINGIEHTGQRCPSCGGSELSWQLSSGLGTDEWRLRVSDIKVIAYLYCEHCPAPLRVIEREAIEDALNLAAEAISLFGIEALTDAG